MSTSPRSTAPLRRAAVIHIGDRKTGSTTIQRFLDHNKETLAADGRIVSDAAYKRSYHSALTCYALADDVFDVGARRHWEIATTQAVADFRERFAAALRAEAEAAPAGATLLFSHEDLFRLPSQDVSRLAALLRSVFDDVAIVVYLRRQVDRDASEYGQILKAGHTGEDLLNHCASDYDDLLGRWSDAFGAAALKPRIFEPGAFVGGDLIDDFCAVAGLGDAGRFERVAAANESLSVVAQDFLRAFNTVCSRRDGFPHGVVVRALLQEFAGSGRLPSRKDAAAHMERYRQSNERVRKRWFPDRAALFNADVSRFPERAAAASTLEETAPIVLRLLQRLGARIEKARGGGDRTTERVAKLRERNGALRGKLAAATERGDALEQSLSAARQAAEEALTATDPTTRDAALRRLAALPSPAPKPKPKTAARAEDPKRSSSQ